MDRKVPFLEGEFYHIYNRGIDKRKVFFGERDRIHFQRLLYMRNGDKRIDAYRAKHVGLSSIDRGEQLVDVYAYALMPNHFHLLLRNRSDGGVSTFMSRLLTSFSMYMNIKYDRTGPLMCRPFRAKHVDSDDYFRWLISYMHLNPLELLDSEKEWKSKGITNKSNAEKFLQSYKYSSYRDYEKGSYREESLVLSDDLPDNIPPLFEDFDYNRHRNVLGES